MQTRRRITIGQLNVPVKRFSIYGVSGRVIGRSAIVFLITAFGEEMIQRVPSEPLRQALEVLLFQTSQTHV